MTPRTHASAPAPTVDDFHDSAEVLVAYLDDEADKFGRRTFFAYWLADNIGYHLNEHGVRAQIFWTRPAGFAQRQAHHGRTVRVIA